VCCPRFCRDGRLRKEVAHKRWANAYPTFHGIPASGRFSTAWVERRPGVRICASRCWCSHRRALSRAGRSSPAAPSSGGCLYRCVQCQSCCRPAAQIGADPVPVLVRKRADASGHAQCDGILHSCRSCRAVEQTIRTFAHSLLLLPRKASASESSSPAGPDRQLSPMRTHRLTSTSPLDRALLDRCQQSQATPSGASAHCSDVTPGGLRVSGASRHQTRPLWRAVSPLHFRDPS
jgi:hypothetical protein